MFDAHCHYPNPEAIVCSVDLSVPSGECFARGVGWLPAASIQADPAVIERRLVEDDALMVGEVGLDRRFPDIEAQMRFLEAVIGIAGRLGRSVVLHCVRCDGAMLSVIRRHPGIRFLWHGFNGSYETGKELMRAGALVSVRPGFGKGAQRLIADNPGRVLVETDYTGSNPAQYNEVIFDQYRKASELAGMQMNDYEEMCRDAGKVFTNQQIHR